MSNTIWIVVGVIFVVVWVSIIWEMYNAPIIPDDCNENEINGSENKDDENF